MPLKRHSVHAETLALEQLHIDSVNPEVIVLASLVIAFKFLEDCHERTQYFAHHWGQDVWTCEQIHVTEMRIMESLDWRILPLWDQELIGDALADMQKAGRQAKRAATGSGNSGDVDKLRFFTSPMTIPMSPGQAVVGIGLQLTPVDTPTEEKSPGAFGGGIFQNLGNPSLFRGPPVIAQEFRRQPREHRRYHTVHRLDGLIDGMTHP